MQKWFGSRRRSKISLAIGKNHVREEKSRTFKRFRELTKILRNEQHERRHDATNAHDKERWEDAPTSPFIKLSKRKCASAQLSFDQACDQISRKDKKNINTDVTTGHMQQVVMEQNHAEYGDSPQTINERVISAMETSAQRLFFGSVQRFRRCDSFCSCVELSDDLRPSRQIPFALRGPERIRISGRFQLSATAILGIPIKNPGMVEKPTSGEASDADLRA